MDKKYKYSPFNLECEACSAPMEFDIIKQNYACSRCGKTKSIEWQKKKIEDWADSSRLNLLRYQQKNALRNYKCSNCGAEVSSVDDSEVLTCSFCNTTLIQREFMNTKDFPTGILPFIITENEAKSILEDWIKSKPLSIQARMLKNVTDKLRAIYLPYQLFTGAINIKVKVETFNQQQWYELSSYVNQKLVVASSNLPNHLLQQIEPYDIENIQPFDFIYMAGMQAKTQDKQYRSVSKDFKTEIKEDVLHSMHKQLKVKSLEYKAINTKEIKSVPIFVPVYYLKHKHISLAINGQTGKLCVFAGKTKKNFSWLWKSLLFSLLCHFLVYFVKPDITIFTTPIITVLSAIIAKIRHYSKIKYKYKISNKQFVRNKNQKLEQVKTLNIKEDLKKPLIIDSYKDRKIAVVLKRLSSLRILSYLAQLIFIVFAPFILSALLLPIFHPDKLKTFIEFKALIWEIFTYSAIWLILILPISIVIFIREIKRLSNYVVSHTTTDEAFQKTNEPEFMSSLKSLIRIISKLPLWPKLFICLVFAVPILATIFGME